MGWILMGWGLQGQTIIYSTNYGASNNNVNVNTVTGWSASGAQAGNLNLSTASVSTTYTSPISASGGSNLADGVSGTTAGTAIATLSGQVNTMGYTGLQLAFGYRASSSSYTATVTLEWSADGMTWNSVSLGTLTRDGSWRAINGSNWLSLPSAAENQSNLRFRFTFVRTNTSGNFRIDDFTVRGCLNPTVTLGTNPSVCQGATSANLTYSATTNSPNQYSIDYDATANTAGFVDVTNATLLSSPISLVIPNNVAAGTYNGSLTVRNSTTGCVSTTYSISVTVLPTPTLSTAVTNVPCPSSGTGAINLTVAPTLTIDGNMNEGAWGSALATSTGGAVSAFGAGHELNAIYSIIGSNDLYFGIAGNVQNGNRILLFLDTKSGGYSDGNFGRTGAPQGIDDFNSSTTFDAGFLPDYCLVIGTNGSGNYFFDLFTLAGTAGGGGGSNNFLGDNTSANLEGSPVNSSLTRGFEAIISRTALGYTGGNIQMMAMYIADNGFLNNQFLTKANSGEGSYGSGVVNFGSAAPNPITLNGLTYSWSNSATTEDISSLTTGTYTVVVTGSNGCTASASATVNATNPSPTGVISGTTTICNGGSATLSIAVTGTGPWSGTLSDGTAFSGSSSPITVSVSPTMTTTYTISTLSDANCPAVAGGLSGSAVITVVAQPVGPTLNVKTPSTAAVCTGTGASATFNAGTGGTGCTDDYVVIIDGGTPTVYTPGTTVGTSATSTIVIQGRRANCTAGSGCTGTNYATLASWTVNPIPTLTSPGPQTYCADAMTTPITFSGTPMGVLVDVSGGAAIGLANQTGLSVLPAFTAIAGTATVSFTPKANGCTGTPVQVTYTVNPRPNAGAISGGSAVCQGSTLSLGSDGLLGGTWSSNNGNTTVGAMTGVVTGVTAGTSIITYSVTDGNGCTSATSVTITVDQQVTAANAGGDQSVCSDAFAILAANTPGVGTGTWTVTGPSTLSSQFSSTSSPTATFTPAGGVGTYTLTWTITNGTCVSSDDVIVNALSCLCQSSDASAAAYNDNWDTGDSDNPAAFGAWTLNSGGSNSGRFMGSSTSNNDCALPTGDTNGDGDINTGGRAWFTFAHSSQLFEAFRSFAGIPVNSSLSVRMDNGCIQTGGTVGFALRNASGNTLAEFFFRADDGAYTVNDATSGGSFSNSGVAFTDEGVEVTYVITATGTYTIHIKRLVSGVVTTLTGRSFFNPSGGQVPAQIRLFNFNAGNGSGFNAAYNNLKICRPCTVFTAALNGTTSVCQSATATNLTTTITGGTSPYTVVYSDGVTNFTVTGYVSGNNIAVSPSGTTTYTLVSVQDAGGCFANLTGSPAVVTVNSNPAITASSNSPVCAGNNILLTSMPSGGSGTYTSFVWQGPNSYAGSGQNPTGFPATAAAAGTYTVTVTDNNNCTASNATSVAVDALPSTSVAGSNQNICADQCAVLAANVPVVGTGLWSISAGPSTALSQLSSASANNATFCPAQPGSYTLTWTISNGACPPSATNITILVTDCMCATSVASAAAYDGPGFWQTGDNDATLFGTWTLSTTDPNPPVNGHFVASATGNNACVLPSGDVNGDGDINLLGESWGLYANSGQTASAVRPLLSPLGKGGKLSIGFDNGCIQAGGTVGFSLQNASGQNLAEFYFIGGSGSYTINDAATTPTGISFTDEGLLVEYTITGLSTYDLKVTTLATGAVNTFAGRTFLNPSGGQAPARIRLFNNNAGAGSTADAYYNQLRVCPGCPVYTATIAGTTTICPTTGTNLTITMSGGTGPYTVVYSDGTNNYTVTGYTSGSNIPVTPSVTTTYTVVSATDASGNLCPGIPTGSATVTLRTPPSITAANNGPVCVGNNIVLTSTPASGSGTYTSFSWSGPNSYSAPVEDPAAFAATATSGGTYTVVVTDSNGCTGSTTTNVTVNPLPNAGTISGTLSVCVGSTTSLTSNGTSGGTWSSSNGNATVDSGTGVVSGVTAGTSVVTYTVTDGNGCVSTAMATVTVNQFVAATPVFTETMGTTASTTLITDYELANGFDNDGFTMSGTGDVRSTQSSTGYTGASGGANVFLTANVSMRTFEIAGINTIGFSNLVLSFGVYKSDPSITGSELLVEVSSNGITYTPLSFSSLGSTAAWYYRTATGTIPSTANLRIRFTNTITSTHQFRIDDVTLVGDAPTTGSITPVGPTTFCQGGSVNLTASAASSWLWSTGATTQTITATMAGTYTVRLTSANGCTTVAGPVTVTVNSLPSAAPAPASVCAGSTTTVNGNPSGGSGTYTTHAWTNLGTGTATGVSLSNTSQQTVTVNATTATAGTVNLRYQVTDNNGCSTSATVIVTVNARPSATPASISVCTGSTVNVNGNPSGGTMPYTAHNWTDLGTGTATGYTLSNTSQQTVTVNAATATAGTVILRYQVTDNNGCTRTADVTVTINAFNVAYALFTETVGTISSNPTAIATHEAANGFDNDPFTMTGTGELRNSLPSSGYAGASGSANVFLTNSGTPNFQIAGINTVGLNPVSISFGVKKEANDQDGSALRVDYSTDGISYTTLGFPTLPTGSGTTTAWYYVTVSGAIPATPNLRIRFTNLNLIGLTSNQFRIDDIALNISSSLLTITPSGATTFCTGNSVTLTSSVAPSYLWSTTAVTQAITVNASGTYTVVATDANGCTKSASQVVSVQPQPVGPTLNAKTPNTATVCEGTNVSATINAGTGGVGCSDTYEYSTNNGSSWLPYTPGNNISTTGATVVLIQAKRDGCTSGTGCTGTSFVQLASWTVQTAPVFTACPSAPIVVGTAFPACSAAVNYTVSASGSPTPVLTYAFSGSLTAGGIGTGSGVSFPRGTANVVVAATNVCGSPTCAFTVTVNDDDAPTVACPSNPTINVNSNTCQITVPNYVATLSATDNCSLPSSIVEAQDVPAGAYGPVVNGQVITVTYTATDAAGNTKYCTVAITVSAPEIDVLGNNVSIMDGDVTPDLADHTNFGGTVIGVPLTRTFTISNTGTQPLNISSVTSDNVNFVPGPVTPASPILPGQTATVTVNFIAPPPANTLHTATITIGSNDCSEAVYDFQVNAAVGCVGATIVCPASLTVNTVANTCSAPASYVANLGGNPIQTVTYQFSGATTGSGSGTGSGSTFGLGVTTVSLTHTNVCGSQTCSFTVSVIDAQPPAITCPTAIVLSNTPGQCNAPASYAPLSVSDNCAPPALSYAFSGALTGSGNGTGSGTSFPVGLTSVVLKAIDGAGLMATCSFSVTVNDTQLPTITCPASVTLETEPGQCGAVVNYIAPVASDNCGSVTLTRLTPVNTASGSVFPIGTTTVTWQAADLASTPNTASCSFTVSIYDLQVPSITCPANQTVYSTATACAPVVTYANPTVSDNCNVPPPAVSYSFSGATTVANTAGTGSGSMFNRGITTVTLRATDNGGLTRTCTFRVIVIDLIKPVITCTNPAPVPAATGMCSAVVNYTVPTFTDNCPPSPGTATRISGLASGATFPVGSSTVVYRATDANGNSTTCAVIVQVVDNQPPVITCPPSASVAGNGSPCNATYFYPAVTASDNCGTIQSLFLVSGLMTGSVFPAGTTVNTWRATDAQGQTAQCSFSVTVSCASLRPAASGPSVSGYVGLEESLQLTLAPNPARDRVVFEVAGLTTAGADLLVFDALGRLVAQQVLSEGRQNGQLDTGNWPQGTYRVCVRTDKNLISRMLAVQRD